MPVSFKDIRNIGLAAMTAIIVAIGVVSFNVTARITDRLFEITQKQRPKLVLVDGVRNRFLDAREIFNAFLREDREDVEPAVVLMNEVISEAEDLKKFLSEDDVARMITAARRFRLAIVTYAEEARIDITGSRAREMESIALNTAEETEKASLRLTMETRKSIAAAEGMMLVVARESRRVNFIGMVLGIAAGLLVAFFMGRALNVSIRKLILGIKEVAKGDLSYRVRLGMSDEIGQLADAFNKMADDLGASRRREQEKAAALAEEVVRREHIEVLLRQNEAYLRTIFDSVRTGVMLVDQETHVIVDANPMVVKMFGKPKEQIVGALCHAYVCPAQQGKCPITDLGQTVDNAERIFVTSSGARVPVLKTVLPVTINDRKLLLESFADVTELKAAEKELQFAYDQLRDAQAQLLQTAKMASLGQMAGGVAHEINNPLTGVLNNVQLIKMLAQDRKEFNMKDFDDLLAAIEASAVRCKNITQSLLNFSHTSHGVFQDVSMNEVMEKVVALIEQELRLQNVTIRKELDPDLPLIKGDSQLLQQVVFDLISNGKWAVQKKAEGKGGEIILKTRHDRQNNVVMFSVGDTGIGISRENQEKIFEPFFTTKDVGEGTGLGLSLVFNIIKAHEGTIEIESEVGQGTTFKISLPVF